MEEKTKKIEEEEEEEKTKEHAEDQDDVFNGDGATVNRRPSRAIPRIDEKSNRSSSTISMVAELNKPKASQVGRFENHNKKDTRIMLVHAFSVIQPI